MANRLIPSPPKDKIWGKLTGHALSLSKNRLEYMMSLLNNYGDFVELKMGQQTTYLLTNPEGVDYVLRKNAKNFSKETPGFKLVSDVTGKGVFTESGKSWLEKRKKVNPFFSPKNKIHWLPHIIETANELIDDLNLSSNKSVNICPLMTRSTLQILGRTIFNEDLGKFGDIFEKELNNLIHLTEEKITQIIPIPTPKKVRQRKSFEKSMSILDGIILDMINRAKERPSEPDKNMIHTFLEHATDETTEKYLIDQIKTMAFAGHETSSNVLSWSMYLILNNPEWHNKIKAEIDSVIGPNELSVDNLNLFPNLTMALKESMRLYPPAWSLGRKAESDDEILGHKVKQGDIFIISPYLTQHNRAVFTNPDDFSPERFSEENEVKIPSGAYIPFGIGPRSCIGEGLAMMEIIGIIVKLFQNFEMELDKRVKVEINQKLTLQAKNGINVFFKRKNKKD